MNVIEAKYQQTDVNNIDESKKYPNQPVSEEPVSITLYEELSKRDMKPPTPNTESIDIISSYRLPAEWELTKKGYCNPFMDDLIRFVDSTNFLTDKDKTFIFQLMYTTLKEYMFESIIGRMQWMFNVVYDQFPDEDITNLFNETKDTMKRIMYASNDLDTMFDAWYTWNQNRNEEEKSVSFFTLIDKRNKTCPNGKMPQSWLEAIETRIKINMFRTYNNAVDEVTKAPTPETTTTTSWCFWC